MNITLPAALEDAANPRRGQSASDGRRFATEAFPKLQGLDSREIKLGSKETTVDNMVSQISLGSAFKTFWTDSKMF
jgi:hypothetical protein